MIPIPRLDHLEDVLDDLALVWTDVMLKVVRRKRPAEKERGSKREDEERRRKPRPSSVCRGYLFQILLRQSSSRSDSVSRSDIFGTQPVSSRRRE